MWWGIEPEIWHQIHLFDLNQLRFLILRCNKMGALVLLQIEQNLVPSLFEDRNPLENMSGTHIQISAFLFGAVCVK